MNELNDAEAKQSFTQKYTFIVLVSGVIGIAIVLVIVSMMLYAVNGTAQLDLSRPGYEEVSKEATKEREKTTFDYSATGPINEQSIQDFQKLYKEQSKNAKAVDAFSGNPLTPEALGLDDSSASQ